MNVFLISFIFIIQFPLWTNSIRCYQCDGSNECKTISTDSLYKNNHFSSENVEIVDCEYYCWKSVSLGKQ